MVSSYRLFCQITLIHERRNDVMVKRSQKSIGLLMGCVAATAWGTFGIFSTFLSNYGLQEETISMVSSLFLFVLFTVLSLTTGGIRSMKVPRGAIVFLIFDGLCAALYNYSAVQAYANLSIGVVSTIIYCNLFVLIFICRLIFKDPITKQKVLAVAIALFGVMLVVDVFHSGNVSGITAKGLFWAFLSMLAWTGLIITEKLVMNRGVTPDASCAYEGLFSLVIIGAIGSPSALAANFAEVFISSHGMVILPLLGFGFISTMAAYYFYMHALNIIEPTYVQICYTLDPAVACILGLVVFGQTLTFGQVVGIVIILATVIWLQVEPKRLKPPTDTNASAKRMPQ